MQYPTVNLMAGPWWLAGKNSFNRWRGWRDSGAGLLDWGCGCFQSFALGLSRWSMVTSPDSPQKTPANTHITLINKVKTRIAPTYLQSPKIGLNGVLKVIFGNRWQLNIQVKPTFLFGYCGANLALRGSVITNLSR